MRHLTKSSRVSKSRTTELQESRSSTVSWILTQLWWGLLEKNTKKTWYMAQLRRETSGAAVKTTSPVQTGIYIYIYDDMVRRTIMTYLSAPNLPNHSLENKSTWVSSAHKKRTQPHICNHCHDERTFMATVMAVICSTAFPIIGSRISPTKVLLKLACIWAIPPHEDKQQYGGKVDRDYKKIVGICGATKHVWVYINMQKLIPTGRVSKIHIYIYRETIINFKRKSKKNICTTHSRPCFIYLSNSYPRNV